MAKLFDLSFILIFYFLFSIRTQISPPQLQPQQQYKFEKLNNEINDLREKNDLLWKAANGRLLTDVNKVQSNQLKFKHEKVCVDIESKLNDCYMRNSSKPLLCSSLAKEFWSCVNNKKQIN